MRRRGQAATSLTRRSRYFRCWRVGWPAAAALLLLMRGAVAAPKVVDLPIANGISERVLYLAPDNPSVALVMLPGGDGVIDLGADGKIGRGGNFLVRTRGKWVASGAALAIPDAPSDGNGLMARRLTPFYAQAVRVIVEFVRKQTQAPIWLVGTSQGTNAAVNAAAAMTHGEIAGIVLTSSLTRAGRRPELSETVYGANLAAIDVPVLIASHEGDACVLSPPSENPKLQAALTHTPRSAIITFTGGLPPRTQPCDAFAQHGFYGIEGEVVTRILAWTRG
jgi:hypothetical protein